MFPVKTTIEIPDDLLIEAKKRAAEERTTLRKLFARGLRRELGATGTGARSAKRRRIGWVVVDSYDEKLTVENALRIFSEYDIIVDGSDNFQTRYLVNDAAYFAGKPLIYGSIFRFEGQISVFDPHSGEPCYRCLYSSPPPASLVPS